MAKLDHNRPSLRYLDNLRRELNPRSYGYPEPVSPPPVQLRKIQQSANPAAYQRHIQRFDQLTYDQRQVLGQMIEAYGELVEARSAEIESLIDPSKRHKKRRAAREAVQQKVVIACTAFNNQCRSDLQGGKAATREWFRKLLTLLGPERDYWEELEIIVKESR